jgi:hypothetical protein
MAAVEILKSYGHLYSLCCPQLLIKLSGFEKVVNASRNPKAAQGGTNTIKTPGWSTKRKQVKTLRICVAVHIDQPYFKPL